jgi:hypothetical protein
VSNDDNTNTSNLAISIAQAAVHGGVANEVLALLTGQNARENTGDNTRQKPAIVGDTATSAAPNTKENSWGEGETGPEYWARIERVEAMASDSELSSLTKEVSERLLRNRQKRRQTNS